MDEFLSLKDGESLYIIDLETVSFLNEKTLIEKASDDEKYYKMPFLYLIAAYVRNQAIKWADKKYTYIEKKNIGNWMIYKFQN